MLILGSRYGSVEPKSGKSYTQLEYEYALEIGKPHFAVVISGKGENLKVKKQGKDVLERDHSERYNEFKKLITTSKLVKFWNDVKDIKLAIHETLHNFNRREDLVGWIKGNQSFNTGLYAEEMTKISQENSALREKLMKLEKEKLEQGKDFADENNFKELFDLLERTKIDLSGVNYFGISNLKTNEMDANSLLVVLQQKINGVSIYNPNGTHVLGVYSNYGLIKISKPYSNEMIPKFTSIGVKYLAYLVRNYPELPILNQSLDKQ